VFYMSCS